MKRNKRASSPLDNPAFRRWFGDSVVVDEDGEPLVVYHGTDADEFESFQVQALPRGGRKGRLLGEGFYFTSDPDQAARWGRRVIAAYLRIENPRTQQNGLLVPASIDQDGTIATGAPGTRAGEVWFVVKSPRQIKSATDNDGSFDPEKPDVRKNPATIFMDPGSLSRAQRHRKEMAEELLGGVVLEYASDQQVVRLLKELDTRDAHDASEMLDGLIEVGLPLPVARKAYTSWCQKHARGLC